ncbi:ATP-binding protein [uncultured Desulfuromusa sp.]|uniref:PAS domain-containing sensor histidine kinase n=1 Tax=uncultured Desulfuromusa sp. TaxID=219183 RepID=UPI002AA5FC56|nr:ATP-binding protein [uncultured Desulfuromusa sp.]
MDKALQDFVDQLGTQVDTVLLLKAVEQSPATIFITDSVGRIIYVNSKFVEVTGYAKNEVLGRDARILKGMGRSSGHKEMWSEISSGRQWKGDFHNKKKNGEYFWVRATISPIMDHEGKITNFLGMNEDITDRKQVEEALEQSVAESVQMATSLEFLNAELKSTQSQMLQREKMASIGQLAAGVAHEINNPIGFVSSNLRSLDKYFKKLTDYLVLLEKNIQDKVPETWQEIKPERKKLKIDFMLEDSEDLITESLDGSERVRKIVQNLKTFSRVDQAEEQWVDLNTCLENTIGIVWNEIKYKSKLEKDLGDLPDLNCNPQELSQVFTNILINAAQAIEKDGLIKVRSRHEEESIIITIEDNGSGIAEEHLERIFEPFFTTKAVGEGTGLGMSISYEIIKKHGGNIHIESDLGKGSIFTILLPLHPEEQSL